MYDKGNSVLCGQQEMMHDIVVSVANSMLFLDVGVTLDILRSSWDVHRYPRPLS